MSKNRLPERDGKILLGVMIRGGFLTAEERRDLTELARDGMAEHRLARRANALVLLDRGMSAREGIKNRGMVKGHEAERGNAPSGGFGWNGYRTRRGLAQGRAGAARKGTGARALARTPDRAACRRERSRRPVHRQDTFTNPVIQAGFPRVFRLHYRDGRYFPMSDGVHVAP